LANAGYDHVELVAVDEPVLLGVDADDAYAFVRGLGITNGSSRAWTTTHASGRSTSFERSSRPAPDPTACCSTAPPG
jgi:hypothetical protein